MDGMSNPHEEVRAWAKALTIDSERYLKQLAHTLVTGSAETHYAILRRLQQSASTAHRCAAETLEALLTGQMRTRVKPPIRANRRANPYARRRKAEREAAPIDTRYCKALKLIRKREKLLQREAAAKYRMKPNRWKHIESSKDNLTLELREDVLRVCALAGVEIGENDE